jgi:glycosyltransferase involved in cell wall biosynthesis
MAAAPPVTVVTTTYNWPSALAVAMRCVLAQSFGDFEYLVVGDGCTDETEELVRSIDDPRIVWRNLPQNTGNQSGASKAALEMARGGLIAYLNHDDLWFDDHLALLVPAMQAEDLDFANSLCIEVSPPASSYRGLNGLPVRKPSGEIDVHANTTCVIHTAEAARAAGGWRDWRETDARERLPTQDFFRRLRALRGRFRTVPEATAFKFHSADRPGSYRHRSAEEQQAYAVLMRSDPDLRHREVMRAILCRALGEQPPKVAHPPRPADAPAGWQIEQWRRIRGLHPMLDLGDSEPPAAG